MHPAVIPILGAACLGLVWGWLLGGTGGRSLVQVFALGAATLLVAIEVRMLTDTPDPAFFLGATGVSLVTHRLWRQKLRSRRES